MGKFGYTFQMMGASWDVLKKDRELLLFPLFSCICCLLVMVSFAWPMVANDAWAPPSGEEVTQAQEIIYYLTLFMFYFCNYFVIVFFNSAIVACAIVRMRGGDPTLATGFQAAMSRLPQIIGWALLSATFSVIIRIIENSNKKAGRFIAGLLGMAWTLMTFLVVPVLVVEKKGPVDAFKESTKLLKKTWGEQLISGFGFGMVFFLLTIPGIVIIGLGIYGVVQAGAVIGGIVIGLGVLYMILLALIQSALQTIFQAALYLYAHDGIAPAGFDQESLQSAMRRG